MFVTNNVIINNRYFKAGSVLRMFQHTVGEEIFRDALHIYLTKK